MRFYWQHRPEDDGRISITQSGYRKTLKFQINNYLKLMAVTMVILWASMPLYFGAWYKRSAMVNNLTIHVIDLDGGFVGSNVTHLAVSSETGPTLPRWKQKEGIETLDEARAWVRKHGWGALVINKGASDRLRDAVYSGAEYNPKNAVTLLVSTGRQVSTETLYIEQGLASMAKTASFKLSLLVLSKFKDNQLSNAKPNVSALVYPLGFTMEDVSPYTFLISPLLTLLGLFVIFGCTIGIMIIWKILSYGLFLKVKLRDIVLLWITLIVGYSLLLSLYYALAFVAFRGPHYDQTALPFTADKFFKVWFTAAGCNVAVSFWLFIFFLSLPIQWLAFPSVVTVVVNVFACMVSPELAPSFFKFIRALPFFNATKIIQYVLSGAQSDLGVNIGVLVAEIVGMGIVMSMSIWFRQAVVVLGISDMHGGYRGMDYFHAMVPYYKDTTPPPKSENSNSSDSGTTVRQQPSTTESINGKSQLTGQHSSSSIDIHDSYGDDGALKTGNLAA